MSQHLFAADQLAHGEGGRLLSQGYPLGPHSLVVATTKGTGASLVHAFNGLALATAAIAALTALALLRADSPDGGESPAACSSGCRTWWPLT